MKKILLSSVLVFTVAVVNAQISAGLKLGMNLSQMRFEMDGDSETSDMALGVQTGGFVNFKVSETFSVQPELLFSRYGGKQSEYDDDLDENITQTFKADYLAVPLMLKFNVAPNVNIQFGPEVGILLAAKVKAEALGQSISLDVKDLFNTVNFGINGGLGFSYQKFGFDARYFFGIANVVDDPEFNTEGRYRSIQFAVSYRLTQD